MSIKILPDIVINKIAAGEVIDRPVSVVRELIDNALDAGARSVSIRIAAGGRSLIEVQDDGCGMERDDALLAFERHATSKISDDSDLKNISTYGFRGEALASIAAVSKISLITRSAKEQLGTEVIMHAGKLKGVNSVAATAGTSVAVRSLFYNMPARRKFLRQPKTEELKIKTWVLSAALGRPDVHFRLTSDGRELINLSAKQSLLDRASQFIKGSTVMLEGRSDPYSLSGIVGHPGMATTSGNRLVILVNGRVVSDRLILRAVRDGFHSTLKPSETPVGIIALELPGELVDVNVHPQKSEVRFREPGRIFNLVQNSVNRAVTGFRQPVKAYVSNPYRGYENTRTSERLQFFGKTAEDSSSGLIKARRENVSAEAGFVGNNANEESLSEDQELPVKYAALKFVGQALNCFIFLEDKDAIYVVDMHAAHERCRYNEIKGALEQGGLRSQQLLMPEVIELGEERAALVVKNLETLTRFGFEIEPLGDDSVVVRAVPTLLGSTDISLLLREIGEVLDDKQVEFVIKERLDAICARIACHSSVRSGDELTRDEVYALLEMMDRSDFAAACPHGRPVVVKFSRDQIESWFGRDR
ncbi:MAG: DNA mismatch repair endonuclease MutL [Candidatus Dadabacteria bacterium]|nr:MAG: DNA mismatch repair endonuclease MutL [Candidatus Dadabacteria bacterium]